MHACSMPGRQRFTERQPHLMHWQVCALQHRSSQADATPAPSAFLFAAVIRGPSTGAGRHTHTTQRSARHTHSLTLRAWRGRGAQAPARSDAVPAPARAARRLRMQ